MAQVDEDRIQVTFGIVGVGSAPIDLLVHQGRKLGLDRELLEAVPVVRFGLRAQVLDRPLVVVMSAAPLDVVQADAVIAVDTGEDGLDELLARFELLPVEASSLTVDELSGRVHEPVKLLLNAGAPSRVIAGFGTAPIDLASGEGISAAINPLVSRVAALLEAREGELRACPTLVLHASHRARSAADLQPATFPKPASGLALNVSLHEPFGDEEDEWSCAFEGVVDAASDLHTVSGTIEPAGDVPEALDGRWRVELFRAREIWILRSMERVD